MLLTLALVVLCAAIVISFSQEFISLFKEIFAIKGMKLFLPLLIASLVIYMFDYWILWFIYYYLEMLQKALELLTKIMPFEKEARNVALIILLTLVSVGTVFLLDWYIRHKTFKSYKHPYLTSSIIFLVSTISLLALSQPH